ncbi:MAG: HD domain-containing protein [Thermodesulfobacteriota bacterium]
MDRPLADEPVLDRDRLAVDPLLPAGLRAVATALDLPLHITGGAVRDWYLGKDAGDIDVTVAGDPLACARTFAAVAGGTVVVLDAEHGIVRVAGRNTLDFCGLRPGCATLIDDLLDRDFTINALAVPVDGSSGALSVPCPIIDPTGGIADLRRRRLRAVSDRVFRDDPLRLLRAFRFAARLQLAIDEATMELIRRDGEAILAVAGERIGAELDGLMAAPEAAPWILAMVPSGLLWRVLPELRAGYGCRQPDSHHLDVFHHSVEALACMERLLTSPAAFFPAAGDRLRHHLAEPATAHALKWAALLHDLGKPAAFALQDGRITFHNHDQLGAGMVAAVAERLRWSRRRSERVARLIANHMWPFHLNNVYRKEGRVSARACLRLAKKTDLEGVFLLAMADSLAGQGPGKPAAMEKSLAELYRIVATIYEEKLAAVLDGPPLVTGHDLIETHGLTPGPLFRQILTGVEEARAVGEINDRQQALAWISSFLSSRPEDSN